MIKKVKLQQMITVLLLLITVTSCKYYTIKTHKQDSRAFDETIDPYYDYNNDSYFLHVGNQFWLLENATVTDGQLTGSGLIAVDKDYSYFYNKVISGNSSIKKVKKRDLEYVNQVHVYADLFSEDAKAGIIINLKDITKVDVMKDAELLNSFIVGTAVVAGTVVGTVVVSALVVAILCNCPHNYTFDGEQYHYNNTLFTGATSAALERNDFKKLPDYLPESESYQLMIKNEENEIQYTNLLELIAVQHDLNTVVIPSQQGDFFTISNLQMPLSTKNDLGQDLQPLLSYDDEVAYAFDNKSSEDFANVYAVFDAPKKIKDATLIIKAKNTRWSGFVYDEFSHLFGNKYQKWNSKLNERSTEEVNNYRKKAGIPLAVSIKVGDKWVDVESIDLIGEVFYNTVAVAIDPTFITDKKIEIKLTSGFKFWELDYIALDNSSKENIEIQYLQPSTATMNGTLDETENLKADDSNYMVHEKNGDSTIVMFKSIKNSKSKSRSLFLRSKGYYVSQRNYQGKPNRTELVKFKQDGEMSRYSKRLYLENEELYTLINR